MEDMTRWLALSPASNEAEARRRVDLHVSGRRDERDGQSGFERVARAADLRRKIA